MKNPLIVALDVAETAQALRLVNQLGNAVSFFKIGMEFYAAGGPSFVREVSATHDVFLDMKFYDIPETVKRATAQVAGLGVKLLTVHGSSAVMRAASRGNSGRLPRRVSQPPCAPQATAAETQDFLPTGAPLAGSSR